MSDPPPLPLRIGYDRRRVLRSALVLLVVAVVAGIVVTERQRARPSAAGSLLAARSLGPVPLLFALVVGIALLVIAVALSTALRRRDFLVLREDGIEFHNVYGSFRAGWENLACVERAPAGYAGLRFHDRARLLETHQGSAEQRRLLATIEPFGEYDLILHPEELSCGVDRFVAWANALRERYSKNSVWRSGEE